MPPSDRRALTIRPHRRVRTRQRHAAPGAAGRAGGARGPRLQRDDPGRRPAAPDLVGPRGHRRSRPRPAGRPSGSPGALPLRRRPVGGAGSVEDRLAPGPVRTRTTAVPDAPGVRGAGRGRLAIAGRQAGRRPRTTPPPATVRPTTRCPRSTHSGPALLAAAKEAAEHAVEPTSGRLRLAATTRRPAELPRRRAVGCCGRERAPPLPPRTFRLERGCARQQTYPQALTQYPVGPQIRVPLASILPPFSPKGAHHAGQARPVGPQFR